MGKFGRFEGGQHYKALAQHRVKVAKITEETKLKLKELNIPYNNKMTEIRAKYLIKEQNRNKVT